MSKKTLREKLEHRKLLEIRTMVILFFITMLMMLTISLMSIILGILESTQEALVLLILIGASHSLVSLEWLRSNVANVALEIDVSRNEKVVMGILAIVPQLLVLIRIVSWNFNLVFISVVLLYEFVFYIVFSMMGTLPGNRISFWSSALCIFAIIGFQIATSPYTIGFSGVTVEIIGAFIGIFAAISLSEVLKESENIREGRNLRVLLLEELQDIEQQLIEGVSNQVPNPVWSSAFGDGSLLKLPSDFRKRATQAHKDIHYFNQDPRASMSKENALKSIQQVID